MQFILHVKDHDDLPGALELGLSAEELQQQMIAAHMPKLAKSIEAKNRVTQATEHYQAMNDPAHADDTPLYREAFPYTVALEDNDDPLTPEEILAVIIRGRKAFDEIVLWRNAGTETLVVGILKFEDGKNQHFLLAQWGDTVTTAFELRHRHYRQARQGQLKQYWPSLLSMALIATVIISIGILGQPWPIVMAPAGVVLYLVVVVRTTLKEPRLPRYLNLILAFLALMTSFVSASAGMHQIFMAPRVDHGDVCHVNGQEIQLDNGDMITVEAGTYGGKHLSGPAAAKWLNAGKTYDITLHGAFDSLYASGAQQTADSGVAC